MLEDDNEVEDWRRVYCVHPMDELREAFGEFRLETTPIKFFQQMRMSTDTFDFILAKVEGKLRRKRTCKLSITLPKKLYVTLR